MAKATLKNIKTPEYHKLRFICLLSPLTRITWHYQQSKTRWFIWI